MMMSDDVIPEHGLVLRDVRQGMVTRNEFHKGRIACCKEKKAVRSELRFSSLLIIF